MLDVKTWVRSKLIADSALVALLGSTDQLLQADPNDFETLPVVIFTEANQPNPAQVWMDDQPQGIDTTLTFDVYVGDGRDTTPIVQALDAVLVGLRFGCLASVDVPDPDSKIHHRHTRYTRVLTPQELV